MDREDEVRALDGVRLRLRERFPDVGADVVESAVQAAHAKLQGPVRDFVPVLVEHAARQTLVAASRPTRQEPVSPTLDA